MAANEMRLAVKECYEEILDRNFYSQDEVKRQCVFQPYKDGKYYSDCSSSILNSMHEAGVIDWRLGNTATIHEKGINVYVDIVDGIVDESGLRVGDCLLFRGNDPKRPLQIGHVELYAGNGKIYGHGSGKPSVKDLMNYCASRQRQRASNGLSKGLVEVRRFIPDDEIHISVKAFLTVQEDLNYRVGPGADRDLLGTFKKGTIVEADEKCNRWFHVKGRGWCSAKYLKGWVLESERYWYLLPGYTWPEMTVMEIGGEEYAFDHNGWLISSERINSDGAIIYP